MKTPDEIKRDMIECMEDASCVVEYGDAHDLIDAVEKAHATMADGLSLIRRLERDVQFYQNIVALNNKTIDEQAMYVQQLVDRVQELDREKVNLLNLCEQFGQCVICKHTDKGTNESPCCDCWYCNGNAKGSHWEWRGVEEEKHEQD